MSKKFYLIFFLISINLFCHAQQKHDSNIFQKKLSNGLDIVVVEDHSVPLETVMMTFKAGAFTESDDISGLTGIYVSMLWKGNKDYANERELNYHSGELGMELRNYITSSESATMYFTLPAANFVKGLNFLNSAVRFPNLNLYELENAKQVSNNQLEVKESNPYYILLDSIDKHLWGHLYNRKKGIGNHDIINSITPDMINRIKTRYFYPNNALLIIGGDVDHETAFREIEKIYGDWTPAIVEPLKQWPIPEFDKLKKSSYSIVESKVQTSPSINIYWQGPDTRNDISSTYAADVFSYIINQNSSRLHKALVESGLAVAISFNYLTCKYVGPISLIVTPAPDKIKECIDEIKKQIELMDTDDYLTIDQIETAKRMLEIKNVREEEITSNFVHTLSFWWTAASIDYFSGYNGNLNKVTRQDIKNYVRKYIKDRPYCAGLLINQGQTVQINADSFFTNAN